MDGQVGDGAWERLDAPPPADGTPAGFEAIAGSAAQGIHAVGWGGEIWSFDGSAWTRQPSPTDVILTGLHLGEDGTFHACGQAGTLLRGRGATWTRVRLGPFAEDLWDVHAFGGRVNVAAPSGPYVVGDGGLSPVDFGVNRPTSCHRFTSSDGVLWCIGDSDVFRFDGVGWARVD